MTPAGRLTLPDGRELTWDEYGVPDGPVVFFLHGVPACRVLWSGIGRQAREAGVRLVAPDRPGCGLSTFQPGRRITDWPADLSALADHLGVAEYRVAGTSGGGPYALACAAAGDARLVRTAVVCGIGPLDTPEARAALTEANRFIFDRAAEGVEALTPIIEAMTAGAPRDEATLATVVDRMAPEDQAVIAAQPGLLGEMLDLTAAAEAGPHGLAHDTWLCVQPWGFEPAGIAGPVDFYAADHDRNAPVRPVLDQAEAVPHSTLTVWPGSGHLAALVRLGEVLERLLRVTA